MRKRIPKFSGLDHSYYLLVIILLGDNISFCSQLLLAEVNSSCTRQYPCLTCLESSCFTPIPKILNSNSIYQHFYNKFSILFCVSKLSEWKSFENAVVFAILTKILACLSVVAAKSLPVYFGVLARISGLYT